MVPLSDAGSSPCAAGVPVGSIQPPAQNLITCLVISFIMCVCRRCISAVQKPRMAPAQALAWLSHMLRKD